VLAHERCHLRRRDNLWSALHRLVEVGFWFHPFVWWIGARMVAERERACDEAVLAEGRDPAVYARAMIEVCRHFVAVPVDCAAGISGGGLSGRVRAVLDRKLGARLTPLRALLLAVLAVAAVAAPVAAGMAWAQAATQSSKLGSFDAFTIKPAAPLGPGRMMFRFDPTRVTIEGATFGTLIERAFDLQPFLFVFPDSLSKQRWDITAVTSAPVAPAQMNPMLQALLVQQFQIKFHHESREMEAYGLEVGDAGAKVAPAAMPAAAEQRGGNVHLRVLPTPGGAASVTLAGTMTLAALAKALAQQLGRPVLDETRLAGAYAVTLNYAMPAGGVNRTLSPALAAALGVGRERAPASASAPPLASAPAPSLASALGRLGLKLIASRRAVSVLVIDSAAAAPLDSHAGALP
ncbi:MAG TPA: M56 family metallopeptidase, partial [Terriglobales bacterium]|nr:M56 family metallopeptidase [Terriglobales bacterium]